MKSKSVIPRGCLAVTIICAFTVLTLGIDGSRPDGYSYKEMEIIDDLPLKYNMEPYLGSLEMIINFISSHKVYVDKNLSLGVFLTNVHLRSALHLRGQRLPAQKRARLRQMLKAIDEIMKYFFKMVQKLYFKLDRDEETPIDSIWEICSYQLEAHDCHMLNLVFTNMTTWPDHLQRFSIDLMKKTNFYPRKELERVYFKWSKYQKKVFDFTKSSTPSPNLSDNCLKLLGQNPFNQNIRLVHCQVPYNCVKSVLNGSDFGYGITHRLLFLSLARLSRRCVVLSAIEDKHLIDKMCAKMYNEVEFIANHDFALPDLAMEHISLCSLEGHAQFLRRSWIDELLDFQTSLGCFNLTRPGEEIITISNIEEVVWQITSDNKIMEGSCYVHVTSVAGAMLAAAVRYIIENYY